MPEFIDNQFMLFMLIGFAAQLVDGALGMAYGLTASSFLLAAGLPPATASATVHFAETFTTGASAISHHSFGNVHSPLFKKLVIPGVLGAALGAYVLTELDGDVLKPYVAGYLIFMGLYVLVKSFAEINPIHVQKRVGPLGFFGGLIDSIGGGGWGPIVTSTLLARGNHTRYTIGTVNAVEFFVTLTSSAVFIAIIGISHWNIVLALALGGVLAAPIAGFVAKKVPHRPMMFLVGLLIIGVSSRTLWNSLG
ncbi:MAG: sulfite exporter TauE/SafE family protein [Arenimonas sp.]|nr:sulfite exporter TauE/SafE family protein [Arenimonas sp.]MBP6309927.1 sulfite exporter TauE/SafE family protein [Arenimonas sp.]